MLAMGLLEHDAAASRSCRSPTRRASACVALGASAWWAPRDGAEPARRRATAGAAA